MTSTYAKVICDSIANDVRLTTLELYYPLMIHAQLMTHRMFSRNAQSNRATPVAKMLEQVRDNPAMPSHWGKNQAGMQDAGDNNALVDVVGKSLEGDYMSRENAWRWAAKDAVMFSSAFSWAGYHKQVANRLTMPFQYIKVIVTATDLSNFFSLRLNDADPTMMDLAGKMNAAMIASNPKELKPGEWHLPMALGEVLEDRLKSSVAACARISLNNHDGSSRELSRDIKLHDTLLKDGHMSCFEHQLTPMTGEDLYNCEQASKYIGKQAFYRANFNRWTSYRWKIENKSQVY